MTKDIAIGVFVTEFAGDFPQLETPTDIDVTELGESPFFVTLPIIPMIGQVSANGLLYDDALAASIEEQINSKRPGANFGHLPKGNGDSAFPHPKAFWVSAQKVGQTLWAKAWIPQGEAREHLRNLKAVGGRIATSIFGRGDFEKVAKGVQKLVNFTLETVDFAPPERAALGYSAPVIVTAEMVQDEEPAREQEHEMSATEVIQELRAVKVPPNKGWKPPAAVAEEVTEMAAIRQTLGVDENADLRQLVSELREQTIALTQSAIQSRIVELVTEGIKLPDAREMVAEFIYARNPQTVQEAEQAYNAVVEMPSVKKVLALTVASLAGPAAIVNGKVQEAGRLKLTDTPEARARALAQMGINI